MPNTTQIGKLQGNQTYHKQTFKLCLRLQQHCNILFPRRLTNLLWRLVMSRSRRAVGCRICNSETAFAMLRVNRQLSTHGLQHIHAMTRHLSLLGCQQMHEMLGSMIVGQSQ